MMERLCSFQDQIYRIMKTIEVDIRNCEKKHVEDVETPILETKVEVFSRPVLEVTITPPKHKKRVLQQAKKTSVTPEESIACFDVEFHIWNKTTNRYLKWDKKEFLKHVPVGDFDKNLSCKWEYVWNFPMTSTYTPPGVPAQDIESTKLSHNKYKLKYKDNYFVEARLLKDGEVVATSNCLDFYWNSKDELKRKSEHERINQLIKEREIETQACVRKCRKQAEIDRRRKINQCICR